MSRTAHELTGYFRTHHGGRASACSCGWTSVACHNARTARFEFERHARSQVPGRERGKSGTSVAPPREYVATLADDDGNVIAWTRRNAMSLAALDLSRIALALSAEDVTPDAVDVLVREPRTDA